MTPIERLKARAENAYVRYIQCCGRNECLGLEAKIEKGVFGLTELEAHKAASEMLGWHRAYMDAIKLLIDEAGTVPNVRTGP